MTHRVSLLIAGTLLAGNAVTQPGASTLDEDAIAYPIVLTPTRLRQAIPDVPASVSIITSGTIQRYGVTSVPDALRLVPGMLVTQAAGGDYRINYHGTKMFAPRRMNVLIDGVSVYRPAFALVDWARLPVAIEDVDRIEVTRGPNSAAYGPNSMQAVVNIITKHPNDVGAATVSTTLGTEGDLNVIGRFAANLGPTALRLTINHERDGGDEFFDPARSHDGTKLDRLNIRSETAINSRSMIGLDFSYVDGTIQVPFVEPFQTTFPDQHVQDHYASLTWRHSLAEHHQLQVRGYHSGSRIRQRWSTCIPTLLLLPELFALWRANPGYVLDIQAGRPPAGGSPEDDALAAAAIAAIRELGPRALEPTCATPNQDLVESRADLELQDTYVFSDRVRLVSGLGVREHRAESATYLGGSSSNAILRAFANVEFKPVAWMTVNAGAYAERSELTGFVLSPRFAANVRLDPNQTLRLVWARGARSPDIFEQQADWSYALTDLDPPFNGSSRGLYFQSARSPGDLRNEQIISTEVGYLLNLPPLGMLLDVRAFDERLFDLISERLAQAGFAPTNDNSVRLTGAELQANAEFSSSWSGFVSYAYLRNHRASTSLEQTQYSRHSGAIGMTHASGNGWRCSLAYFGSSGNGVDESRYGRLDFTLHKEFEVDAAKWATSLTVRRLDNRSPSYFGVEQAGRLKDRVQLLGRIEIGF